jgi:hypothetical protein
MNTAEVRAVPVMNGWEGHFRKLDKAGWHAVQVNGVVQLFETEDKAKIAAYEAMNHHHFGAGILRAGEKMSAKRTHAEELFGKVFPGKGRKPVEVVRR